MRFLLILLMPSTLFAETYLYRVDINKVSLGEVKTAIFSTETKDASQPYINTNFMTQPDTNYYLISMTPKDGENFKLEQKIPGVDLYQIIKLEDGFFVKSLDNSSLYPTDYNWSIKKSS